MTRIEVFAYRSFDQSLMFRRFTYASILFYCPMQWISRKRISGSPITESFCSIRLQNNI